MARTDTPALVCLDCARAHALEKPLGVYEPHPGRCELCGRCTLIIELEEPGNMLDTWMGP